MKFKVGQKYRIVDIDAWWDREAYQFGNHCEEGIKEFQNGDIVEIINSEYGVSELYFRLKSGLESQAIESLMHDKNWHDSCVELIEE